MFQKTIKGFKKKKTFNEPLVICSDSHKFLAVESLSNIRSKNSGIIVEEIQRNTATSVLLGVLYSLKNLDSDYSLITPSDHHIPNRNYEDLIPGNLNINDGHYIYGIKPLSPSSDFGYIEVNDYSKRKSKVTKFHEKPSERIAKTYIKNNFFWNSGIFLINNKIIVNDYKRFQPRILKYCEKIIRNLKRDLEFFRAQKKLLAPLPDLSFDSAILEKNNNLEMVKLNIEWKDLGTWNALKDTIKKSTIKLNQNSKIFNNSKNTLVLSEKKNTVINGVSNLTVVSTEDSLLVSANESSNKIKDILSKKNFKNFLNSGSIVFKPWGSYQVILEDKEYLIKKILVKTSHRLSLQKHKHRSEHWVVVSGKARITKGKKTKIIVKDESTFIPKGEVHCIENCGDVILEIIEIQMGKLLSEDDIIRLDDPYKR